MKNYNYIYGETFIKTKRYLYLIKYYNMYDSNKICKDYYISVKNYSDQKGKTNSFCSCDGNSHIISIKLDTLLFNQINKNSKMYKALNNRIN